MGVRGASAFRLLRTFSRGEEGQATVEYILILSVAVLGGTAILRQLVSILDQGILKIGSTLEKDLKTGRAPLDIWKN